MSTDPEIGEYVRRKDDGRIGQVWDIGTPERPAYMHGCAAPLHNDVIVQYQPGHTSVCTRGAYFWTKWERVDLQVMAQAAMREGMR